MGAPVLVKAIWNGSVLAESDETVVVEGNHYFPQTAVVEEFLVPSATHTVCHWKGTASYYHIEVGGERNIDAAWFYPETLDAASNIRGRVAFWRGVRIEP
jgi:uncharacterized protein (DUF427 family)